MRQILLTLSTFLLMAGLASAYTTSSHGPAVVAFYRAECDGCKAEMPELDKLYAMSEGGTRFKVYGVSLDSPKAHESFVKARKVAYPIIRYDEWDGKFKYPPPFQVPAIYYLTTNGKLAGKGVGWFTAEYMQDQVSPLINKKESKNE